MQGRLQAGDGIRVGDGIKAVQVRFHGGLFQAIESWRRQQRIIPSRPQAIRELIALSLAATDLAVRREVKP
jgi:hypothetical protein